MSLFDEPFQRVVVDHVWPLFPSTDKGNRYILTVIDYTIQYPEANTLPNIETLRVAKALIEIGVSREMITDIGTQFIWYLMSEVNHLIFLQQLMITPYQYHPSCNALLKLFNGTLKQILMRLYSERPRVWDNYLSAVLLTNREVSECLGNLPFELVYCRTLSGLITILKELWIKDIPEASR